MPLWKLLGGQVRPRVRAYNTDIGWLSIGDAQLVDGARRAVDDGFTGIKIKVGSSVDRDLRRHRGRARSHRAVRHAGDRRQRQVGSRHLPALLPRRGPSTLLWFEEPLWYDDVKGHAALARATRIPVALGEQLYTADAFSEFFAQQAIHWVQPDVTRMGGITEVLQVCETAHSLPPAGGAARGRA